MARVDLERKQKTHWPWFVGLALLVVIVWTTTSLLSEDPQAEPEVVVPTVEDTHPPAAVPAPPNDLGDGTEAVRGLEEIAPLGEEDVGQTVRIAGQVVATGNTGFWLLAGNDVVRIDSDRRVRKGDSLSVEGTLRPAEPARIQRIADVLDRQAGSDDWQLVGAVKLVEESDGEAGDARA